MKLSDFNPNETTRKLNPQLFGPIMGAVALSVGQQNVKAALEREASREQQSGRCLVMCVSLISIRKRLVDDDNLVAGFKAMRDCIAASLAVDDADQAIRFEYGQVETRGEEGTIVKMELI